MRSILIIVGVLSCATLRADPLWWQEYGVTNGSPANDYAAINQGQLKTIAAKTRDYFNANIPGGAGTSIDALITSWATPGSSTSDYSTVNLGQLKTVSELFYIRYTLGSTTSYPWTSSPTAAEDYSMANIGQVKNLFTFDLNGDSNWDGLTDYTSLWLGINPLLMDIDGDGVLNQAEQNKGTNPFLVDSDWDTHNDGADYYPLDPLHWLAPAPIPGDHTPPVITLIKPIGAVLLP